MGDSHPGITPKCVIIKKKNKLIVYKKTIIKMQGCN